MRTPKVVEEAKADGVSTEITYVGQSDQASKTAAVTIQAMLEAVGFPVKVEPLASIADQTQRIYATHDLRPRFVVDVDPGGRPLRPIQQPTDRRLLLYDKAWKE